MLINSIRWRPNTVEESRRLLSFVSFLYLAAGPLCVHVYVYIFIWTRFYVCGSFSLCACLCMCIYQLNVATALSLWPCVLQIYPAEKLVADWQYTQAMVSDDQRQAVYLKKKKRRCLAVKGADLFYTGRRENLKHARFAIACNCKCTCATSHSFSFPACNAYRRWMPRCCLYLAETIVCLQGR